MPSKNIVYVDASVHIDISQSYSATNPLIRILLVSLSPLKTATYQGEAYRPNVLSRVLLLFQLYTIPSLT